MKVHEEYGKILKMTIERFVSDIPEEINFLTLDLRPDKLTIAYTGMPKKSEKEEIHVV